MQVRRLVSSDGPPTSSSHLCEFLLIIGPDIAALAATRRSAGQVSLFRRLVDSSSAAVGPREWIEREIALHQALAELSGNPFFQAIQGLVMTALSAALSDMPALQMEMLSQDLIGPNRLIASAIADGDPVGARNGALEVIRRVELALVPA